MKKTFPLHAPGKADARVIEAIKSDVRKYVNRERRKPLPEGFEVWEFNCRVGLDAATAEPKVLKEIGGAIDSVAQTGADGVYVEVLAQASRRASGASAALGPPTDEAAIG